MNTSRSKEFKRSILDNEVSTEIDTIKSEEEKIKIKIKKWRNKQRAREKLLRDTVRKAARHAQKEAIRKGITTDRNIISSNSAEDVAGSTTTLLGAAGAGSATLLGTATTTGTAVTGGLAGIPAGIAAGAILSSGTDNASSEYVTEIQPNSKSTKSTTGKNKIQRMDNDPNYEQINDDQRILLDPDQDMDEIQVDHIRNLDRFIPISSSYRPLQGHYRDVSFAELEENIQDQYSSQTVYIHSFNNGNDNHIPEEYAYLRKNIEYFRGAVNLAKGYVDVALNKLTNTFMNNEQDRFEINHEHPLVKYAEKVFVTTDNNILANIAIRLHDSISSIKMYFDQNHDIYFATANNNINYRVNDDASMAFVLNDDKDKRIIVMVDHFEETADFMDWPRASVSETILHEASHHAIESSDFTNSPVFPTAGNALDFMEIMDELLSPSLPEAEEEEIDRECLTLDPYFFRSYKNWIGDQTITPAQFFKKLKVDPMLKANVMIDNADFLATMIYDIAANQTFPETPLRELMRHRRNVVV